jgi:hypothetical protein
MSNPRLSNPYFWDGDGSIYVCTDVTDIFLSPVPVGYGWVDDGLSGKLGRFYTEILPDISPNRHTNLHNQVDDASPYDNSHV